MKRSRPLKWFQESKGIKFSNSLPRLLTYTTTYSNFHLLIWDKLFHLFIYILHFNHLLPSDSPFFFGSSMLKGITMFSQQLYRQQVYYHHNILFGFLVSQLYISSQYSHSIQSHLGSTTTTTTKHFSFRIQSYSSIKQNK